MIQVRQLAHVYLRGTPFETRALDGVDLSVAEGEALGLCGPTGSGKSTLLLHLNGLLLPQQGSVCVDGIEVRPGADLQRLRARVGVLFQFPEQQLFEETVGEDVAYGPRNLGLPDIPARVRAALERAGLTPEQYLGRPLHELSGGERRRAALAGVLALEPRVLVLDEPTAGLDPRERRDLLARLKGWCREDGLTLVVVSHHMEELAQVVDRVVVMSQGRVVADGRPAALFSQRDFLAAHRLQAPPTVSLGWRLQEAGVPLEELPLTVEQARQRLEPLLRSRLGGKRGSVQPEP